MKRTYHGSCHCGAVRFTAEMDLAEGTSRCNCSICTKARFWKAIVRADALRLLQGEEALTDYRFGGKTIHHLFCRSCGVKPFGRGHIDGFGDFYAVNIACLDDATDEEIAAAAIQDQDGRNDNWQAPPAIASQMGASGR
ncbi:Uncharacterized conserved protein [Rhizobiales bacterium GAS188]|nr:Uncharacterized conserved protein [Rhizobiales bacterium GAS188]